MIGFQWEKVTDEFKFKKICEFFYTYTAGNKEHRDTGNNDKRRLNKATKPLYTLRHSSLHQNSCCNSRTKQLFSEEHERQTPVNHGCCDSIFPVSEAAGWRNVQYSDNISCKLMQVRTLPCWPEGGGMRTGNYRIASRQEMIEIAENGDI